MFVIAKHEISNPKAFFETAEATALPSNLTLHQVFPNRDGTQAVCVWEGPTVGDVRDFVDGSVGDYSRNIFFEVDAGNALGLPNAG